MVLGILILAMLAGFASAVMAFISGHSVLFALAVYSGVGAVSVLVLGVAVAVLATPRDTSAPATVQDRTA